MARLNEPPVSTDSIETLRRKFLRQNRDIARVNSAQSLRIRSLESECGRLLSENLTLNGRILELESELENSKGAQKIADHALEIKAKMEAQLIEWGAMLSGLGLERPTKRQAIASPGGTRLARRRTSVSRSPAAKRRPRDSRSSEEAAALLEGRMPTIQEDKSYSRRTMSHEEVLAICYNTADTNESPDLGPPPTSRFVEDDPVKVDSPTKSIGLAESSPKIKEQALPPTAALSQPLLSQPVLEPKKKSATVLETSLHGHSKPAQASDSQARPSVKAGSKRKFGDENDDDHVSRAFAPGHTIKLSETMLAALTLFFLSLVIALVRGDNTFLLPPKSGINVTEGNQVTIKWTTEWGTVPISLIVFQKDVSIQGWQYQVLLNATIDPGSYVWIPEGIAGLPFSAKFHFSLSQGDEAARQTNLGFNSGALLVVDESQDTLSAVVTSPTTSASAAQAATFSASLQPHLTSTTAAASSQTLSHSGNNHLGPASDVSTIVGTVVGVLGFFVAVINLWFVWRKWKNAKKSAPEDQGGRPESRSFWRSSFSSGSLTGILHAVPSPEVRQSIDS